MEIEGYHPRIYSIHSTSSFTSHSTHLLHTHHTSTTEKSRLHKCYAFQTIRITEYLAISKLDTYQILPNQSFFYHRLEKVLIIPRLGALKLLSSSSPPPGRESPPPFPSVKQEREAPRQISILSMHITYLDRKAIIQDYTASIRLKVHITQHTLTTHTTSTTESPVYTNASHFKPYILLSIQPFQSWVCQ